MKVIKELVDYISSSYNDEEWYIFYDLLLLLKKYDDLEFININEMTKLLDTLPRVNDSNVKVVLIEIIVNFLCYQYDNYEELLVKDIEELFNEYLYGISQNSINIKETRKCLNSFLDLGIEKDKLVVKILNTLHEEAALKILMFIIYDYEDNIVCDKKIFQKIKMSKRLYYRSNIISTFILITNPLCSEYDYIHCVSKEYDSFRVALEDWGWTKENTEHLINKKILSQKEADIFGRLGKMLFDNIEINGKEAKELYCEFFENKDPIEVMFTLPE